MKRFLSLLLLVLCVFTVSANLTTDTVNAANAIANATSSMAGDLKDKIANTTMDDVKDGLAKAGSTIADTANKVGSQVADIASDIGNSTVAKKIKNTTDSIGSMAAEEINSVLNKSSPAPTPKKSMAIQTNANIAVVVVVSVAAIGALVW